ncbi:MAG: DegV family protein [Chloroflexota bacterium]|nr:DegV family protein [Chloroflexota bacterium]
MKEKIKIVVDSCCDLPRAIQERFGIRMVPVNINIGKRSYEDGVDMTREDLYRKMIEEGIIPTTSTPAPGKLLEAYRELAERARMILSIHITSKLSAVYETAVLARSMVSEIDVRVIDSLSASMGTGFLALAAAKASEAGKTVGEILASIEEVKSRMNVFATVSTLKYLRLSGRVGSLQGMLASLLDIKPILTIRDGLVEALGAVRTRARSLDRLVELTLKAVGEAKPVNVAVAHAYAPKDAQQLRERIEATLKCKEVFVVEITPALAVHGGPGLIGVVSYGVGKENNP